MNILSCSFSSSFTKCSWTENDKLRNNDLLCLSESTCKPQTYLLESQCTAILKTKSMTVVRAFFLTFPLS